MAQIRPTVLCSDNESECETEGIYLFDSTLGGMLEMFLLADNIK